MRGKYICPDCGSDDIAFDGLASWNAETQAYTVRTTYDTAWCAACDRDDLHPNWIELADAPAAPTLAEIGKAAA